MEGKMTALMLIKDWIYPLLIAVLAILNYRLSSRKYQAQEFVDAVKAVIANHNIDDKAHPNLCKYVEREVCDVRHAP